MKAFSLPPTRSTVWENSPAGCLLGALEHQMLEEMREAGFAGRLVGRADLVPDHLRDHGRAVVGDHHDLQAVAEREAGGRLRGDRGLGEAPAANVEGRCESSAAKRQATESV